MNQKLLIIDGNSILYRAYYAMVKFDNNKNNNFSVFAVFGFIKMFYAFIKNKNYTNIIVAFDKGKTTFRNNLYKLYKSTRKKTPKDLILQFAIVKEFLNASNIPYYEMANFEADDIIGTISKKYKNKFQINILSSDKDLLQLVSKNVTVFLCKKGVKNVEEYNSNNFYEKKLFYPKQLIDVKALFGDKSDFIPGVKGIGIKKILSIYTLFNDLEDFLKNLDNLDQILLDYNNIHKENPIKLQVKYLQNKMNVENIKIAKLSKQLATIKTNIDLNINLKPYKSYHKDLLKFYDKYNFKLFKEDFLNNNNNQLKKTEVKLKPNSYFKIIKNFTYKYLSKTNYLLIELSNSNYHSCEIIGFCIKNDKGIFYLSFLNVNDNFIKFLKDKNYFKITFNAKRLINSLKWKNIIIKGIIDDVMLLGYILYSDCKDSIKAYSIKQFNNVNIKDKSDGYVLENGKIIKINNVNIANNLATKIYFLEKLYKKFLIEINKNNQLFLYKNIEFPLLFVLAKMEIDGILIDKIELNKQLLQVKTEIPYLKNKIFRQIGYEFNINSSKQVLEVIKELLKKTSNKNLALKLKSSSAIDLLKLIDIDPVFINIINYRKLFKTESIYLNYQKHILQDLRIHTIYQQSITTTGRISSIQPNLQNVTINDQKQKIIRKIFIPKNGYIFISFDYSQIELRILAYVSQDQVLLNAFENNEDIHFQTSKILFNIKNKEEETQEKRRISKAVTFGILYGINPFGLAKLLNISFYDAKNIIDLYNSGYKKVFSFNKLQKDKLKKYHYTETIFHRRRFLDFKNIKNNHKRIAVNAPIQGSAADIIKLAMIKISQELKNHNLKSRMLLQIHDELIFEVLKEEVPKIKEIVTDCMINIKELKLKKINLKVNIKTGTNLYNLK